jgi:hypothetical protein
MRRIFYNSRLAKCLLWPGYSTAMLFGYICTKRKSSTPLSYKTKQHESIHAEQYNEVTMLAFLVALILQILFGGGWWFVPVPVVYYVLYFLEAAFTWLVRLCTHGWTAAAEMAYANSMFEQEARAVVVGDSVQITVTERTLEYRDSTYYARVVGPAVGTLGPRLDYVETYNKTVERVQLVREPYAWELGPAMGAWMTTDGSGVWAGAYVRRTFGRFSVSAAAGYDPRKKSVFGQIEAGVALWRR